MSVTTERKMAAAGMAGAIFASLAALLILSGLVFGLGARNDRDPYTATATGEQA